MTTTTLPRTSLPSGLPYASRQALRLLAELPVGLLLLQTPDGETLRFGVDRPGEPRATLRVADWRVFAAVMRSGDIGFAESFIDGHWSTPDLPALLRLGLANRAAIDRLIHGSAWGRWIYRLRHLLNRNSRAGSRRNIHAHYDLGNAFYREWLDETLTYSAAWFEGDSSRPLVDAQRAKLRRALQQCAVTPGDRVLEIGCGWGSLAECAVREFGARVTGLTLSTEQLAAARARLSDAVASGRADLRLQDYRDLADEPFDAIVSIEMFEAVGREYWDSYFRTVARQLRPGGRACIQSITIDESLFDRYRRSTDFIQQYVFPGGMLPSPTAFRDAAARAGLAVVEELRFGSDYAETLRRWRQHFTHREPVIARQGFDARFMRLWEFYLAYCEAGFDARDIDVVQFTLQHATAARS